MDTLNRVVIIILAILGVVIASLVGLVLFGVITTEQINNVISYQAAIDFIQENSVIAAVTAIVALVVVFMLAWYWLRGQYSEYFRTVIGGAYELDAKGPGMSLVDYDAPEDAIDSVIGRMSGIRSAHTQLYRDRADRLLAHTSLQLDPHTNVHELDERIRNEFNKDWQKRMGINLYQHDVIVNLDLGERRVA